MEFIDPLPSSDDGLDPADWTAFRALAHQLIEDTFHHLETVADRPTWQPMPAAVTARFTRPVPIAAGGAERAYAEFRSDILPYPLGTIHPRFWGWVTGSGLPIGMLAELLTAAMNTNSGGGNHVASLVESQVLAWLTDLLGFPADASGVLVSGGSLANLVGLTVARNAKAEIDVRRDGISAAPRPMTLYASDQTHSSIQRAVELLGLGSAALRLIPSGPDFRIELDALERAIARDRVAGCLPFCVVGNAGTTSTGAIDDLAALADLCHREELWFHVDGAFGALVALAPSLRPLLVGMERADSLAFDLHKLMYLPLGVGCILVRDEAAHRRAFSMTPDYLKRGSRGPASGERWFSDYSPELSRPFRALKVWMAFKTHGAAAIGAAIARSVAQAGALAAMIEAAPDLELLTPSSLNIVCFRHAGNGRIDDLDAFNRELLVRLQERGDVLPSNATIHNRFGLRVAITNHRTQYDDLTRLLAEIRRVARELLATSSATAAAMLTAAD